MGVPIMTWTFICLHDARGETEWTIYHVDENGRTQPVLCFQKFTEAKRILRFLRAAMPADGAQSRISIERGLK
jgi:hypothetical protein